MIEKLRIIEKEIRDQFPDVVCTCVGLDTMQFLKFCLNDYQFVITISPACNLNVAAYGIYDGQIKMCKGFMFGKINQTVALKRVIDKVRELSK